MSPLIKTIPSEQFIIMYVYKYFFTSIRVFVSVHARIHIEMHTYMPRRKKYSFTTFTRHIFLKFAKVSTHYSYIVFLYNWPHAAIAQLAARRSHNPKVVSSILTRRICMCSFSQVFNRCQITCVFFSFFSRDGILIEKCHSKEYSRRDSNPQYPP